MIKQIKLTDFQAHADTQLDFSPGVNCIVGTSDHGKSSIVRAINYVWTNRPGGLGFIRHGQTKLKVEIEKDGMPPIVRERSEADNLYQFGEKRFATVGKDVPPEIVEALAFNEVNIQKQIGLPFLIMEVPSVIAATFNKFTKLDRADAVVTLIISNLRAETKRAELLKVDIEKLQADADAYAWLKEFEEFVDLVDELKAELSKESILQSRLVDSIDDLARAKQALSAENLWFKTYAPKLSAAKNLLSELDRLTADYKSQKDSYDSLLRLLEDIEITTSDINHNSKLPKFLTKEVALRNQLLKLEIDSDEQKRGVAKLSDGIEGVALSRAALEKLDPSLKVDKAELKSSRAEQAKLLEHCPLCEQPLDDETRETVLRNL